MSLAVPLAVLARAMGMLTAAAVPAAAATTYAITGLGSLGYGVSDGLAINAAGQVTGYSCTGATAPASGCCGNCCSGKPKPYVARSSPTPTTPPPTRPTPGRSAPS